MAGVPDSIQAYDKLATNLSDLVLKLWIDVYSVHINIVCLKVKIPPGESHTESSTSANPRNIFLRSGVQLVSDPHVLNISEQPIRGWRLVRHGMKFPSIQSN